MMRYLAFILALLFYSTSGYNQVIKKQNINDVEVDNFHNIYILSGAEVKKYNAQGMLLFQYSNGVYGEIHSIDATNPLRILVFFRESNAIVFLNQQLAELSDPIEIDGLGNFQAQLACVSRKGGFWIYDDIEQAIIHFNNNRSETTRSQNILSLSTTFNAINLQEQNDNLFLSSSENNSLLFDQFGTFLKKLPISIQSKIQGKTNALNYWNGKAWSEYHELTKNIQSIYPANDNAIEKILLNKQDWLIQYQDSLLIKNITSIH